MNPFSPSSLAWLGLVLAALALTPWASAAPDAPAELPPPAAAQEDGPGAAAKTKKPDPADGRCDRCDGCACVRRVCVANRIEKEVVKVCWSYKCEDFCIPGPSIYCGEKCLHDSCGCWTHSIWKPTCAEVRTKRVPVKNQVKRKVPGVEWKVEERCKECRFLCIGTGIGTGGRGAASEHDQPVPRRERDDLSNDDDAGTDDTAP